MNSKGDGCVCIGNYYSDTPSSCAQIPHCQAGASFDISLKACACTVALMHLTPTGCVCPSNMVLDTVSNTCTCDSASYFTSATTCTNCWPNAVSTADRRTCKCSLGYYSVAAFVCKALLTQPSIFEPCAPLPSDQIQTGSYIFTRPTRPACTTVPITFTATGTSINFALCIIIFIQQSTRSVASLPLHRNCTTSSQGHS